jgi:hypothetical protein
MSAAQKALWFIESHLASELTLDEVAAIGGVSMDSAFIDKLAPPRFEIAKPFLVAGPAMTNLYGVAWTLDRAAGRCAQRAPALAWQSGATLP